jgi:hypothetical protein
LQIPEGYFEMSDEQKAAATKAMWSAAMVQMGRDPKTVDAAMGGWKDSGVGSRHGEHGILKYTNVQTVSIQHLLPIAGPRLIPQVAYAKAMTALMRILQRLPGRT